VREQVESIIKSKSKYLNLNYLKNYLSRGKFNQELAPKDFLDQSALIKDVQQGHALEDFMQQYRNISLDVVSMAEVKTIIREAEKSSRFADDISGQMKSLLEHVDDQLKYISNERRQQLTLGEFMSHHHYLCNGSFKQYSNDLLRNQIENTLGKSSGLSDSHPDNTLILDVAAGVSAPQASTDGGL